MKKLILTTALLVVSYLGFSQGTPTAQFRVADRVTAFGQTLPAGTQIYCVLDSTLWQAKVGIVAGRTITTALAELILINRTTSYTVETFDATASQTAFTVLQTPQIATTGVTVAVNGAVLRPTTDYTSAGKVVTLTSTMALLLYDKVVISYTYNR